MSTHRSENRRWLLAPFLGLLLPGAHLRRDHRHGAAVLVWALLGVIPPILLAVAWGGVARALEPSTGRLMIVLAAFLSLALLISTIGAFVTTAPVRRSRVVELVAVTALVIAVLAALVPVATTTYLAVPQIRATEALFVSAPVFAPSEPSRMETSHQEQLRPVAVLLMGGDAGPGRWGLRPDALNVAVFNPTTRKVALIGVPRNLYGAPMPGTLAKKFPRGFPGLINALHTWGEGHRKDVEAALGATETPGASLVAAAVSELTGIRLDGWVLVDMRGFIDAVDSLGGVDIWLDRTVPLPGNIQNAKHPTPARLERGWHRLDGTDLLAYARSRSADSDYARMGRQRCVLLSIAAQHAGPGLLLDWPALAAAAGDGVRTSLHADQLAELLGYARRGIDGHVALAISPPRFRSTDWDAGEVRAAVNETLAAIGAPTIARGAVSTPSTTTPDVKVPVTTPSGSTTLTPAQQDTCRLRR